MAATERVRPRNAIEQPSAIVRQQTEGVVDILLDQPSNLGHGLQKGQAAAVFLQQAVSEIKVGRQAFGLAQRSAVLGMEQPTPEAL